MWQKVTLEKPHVASPTTPAMKELGNTLTLDDSRIMEFFVEHSVFELTGFGFAVAPLREMEHTNIFQWLPLASPRISETKEFALPVFLCRLSRLQSAQ